MIVKLNGIIVAGAEEAKQSYWRWMLDDFIQDGQVNQLEGGVSIWEAIGDQLGQILFEMMKGLGHFMLQVGPEVGEILTMLFILAAIIGSHKFAEKAVTTGVGTIVLYIVRGIMS